MSDDRGHLEASEARTIAWDAAPQAILAAAESKRRGAAELGRVIIVGVTGPVGAGKSTLAGALGGVTISTDSYLPDYESVAYEERDRPESADLAGLARDLADLRARGRARVPVWSFQSHRREGYREVNADGLVVVEGIHALHDLPHAHLDLAVFIESPAAVRWARWEVLESSGQRGWGVETARTYFHRVAEPTFLARCAEYRARAHFIVTNAEGVPAR